MNSNIDIDSKCVKSSLQGIRFEVKLVDSEVYYILNAPLHVRWPGGKGYLYFVLSSPKSNSKDYAYCVDEDIGKFWYIAMENVRIIDTLKEES